MDLVTLLLLAIGLSMDAFAVSICKGLATPHIKIRNALSVGLWFGGFQGLMPMTGYLLGIRFASYIDSFSSWIAFILLSFIGGNMIREAVSGKDDEGDAGFGFREMLLLAVATSIDALAVGITFACVPVQIFSTLNPFANTFTGCLMIAATTCVISILGLIIGNIFGSKYKNKAEIAGGILLILLGIKILAEHFIG